MTASGVVAGSDEARDVAATIRGIETVPDAPRDIMVAVPPVGMARVRRVKARNLWVLFKVRDDAIVLMAVTRNPPVPIDDD